MLKSYNFPGFSRPQQKMIDQSALSFDFSEEVWDSREMSVEHEVEVEAVENKKNQEGEDDEDEIVDVVTVPEVR